MKCNATQTLKDNLYESGELLYEHMSAKEKKRLNSYFQEKLDEQSKLIEDQKEQEVKELERLWLKYTCCILHEAFNFTSNDCMMFIGNMKRCVRDNRKCLNEKINIDEHLADRLSFMEWPEEYLTKLENM